MSASSLFQLAAFFPIQQPFPTQQPFFQAGRLDPPPRGSLRKAPCACVCAKHHADHQKMGRLSRQTSHRHSLTTLISAPCCQHVIVYAGMRALRVCLGVCACACMRVRMPGLRFAAPPSPSSTTSRPTATSTPWCTCPRAPRTAPCGCGPPSPSPSPPTPPTGRARRHAGWRPPVAPGGGAPMTHPPYTPTRPIKPPSDKFGPYSRIDTKNSEVITDRGLGNDWVDLLGLKT